jgi:hypothetical protein
MQTLILKSSEHVKTKKYAAVLLYINVRQPMYIARKRERNLNREEKEEGKPYGGPIAQPFSPLF